MKQFVLVTGPESSGTKLLTRILIEMGYIGQNTHGQLLDRFFEQKLPLDNKYDFVFRRSVPHATEYVDYEDIKNWAIDNQFQFKTIITLRNYIPCLKSKKYAEHPEPATQQTLTKQLSYIFNHSYILRPFLVIPTSFLTYAPERSLTEISSFLNKKIPKINFLYDMDYKHYIQLKEDFENENFST